MGLNVCSTSRGVVPLHAPVTWETDHVLNDFLCQRLANDEAVRHAPNRREALAHQAYDIGLASEMVSEALGHVAPGDFGNRGPGVLKDLQAQLLQVEVLGMPADVARDLSNPNTAPLQRSTDAFFLA